MTDEGTNRTPLTRRLLAVALGAGLLTLTGVTAGVAQDADATPAAITADATPAAITAEPAAQATPGASSATLPATASRPLPAAAKEQAALLVQDATDAIAVVQRDRDAVRDTADLQVVDQLLGAATTLRDQAHAAIAANDASQSGRLAIAAAETARAASGLIEAQLATYGLPSQQAGASRLLLSAYYHIQEATDRTEGDPASSTDAAKLVATAQALYKTAYDLYGGGVHAQAMGTADVAARLAGIAVALVPDDDHPAIPQVVPGEWGGLPRDESAAVPVPSAWIEPPVVLDDPADAHPGAVDRAVVPPGFVLDGHPLAGVVGMDVSLAGDFPVGDEITVVTAHAFDETPVTVPEPVF